MANLLNNKRTNDPVNAHLITGASVRTKTSLSEFDIWHVASGTQALQSLYK